MPTGHNLAAYISPRLTKTIVINTELDGVIICAVAEVYKDEEGFDIEYTSFTTSEPVEDEELNQFQRECDELVKEKYFNRNPHA